MHGEHYRFRQHVLKKYEKPWNSYPEKLDFYVPSQAKTQLPLFHIDWKGQQLDTQMAFKLVRVEVWDEKVSKDEVKKHNKKTSQQNMEMYSKLVRKKGPQKVFFLWFFRVPSQHGL